MHGTIDVLFCLEHIHSSLIPQKGEKVQSGIFGVVREPDMRETQQCVSDKTQTPREKMVRTDNTDAKAPPWFPNNLINRLKY